MPNLTLQVTAQRIIAGTDSQFAIKEHIDEWNNSFNADLYAEEPPLTGVPHVDAWLAGAAEYEAFMVGQVCPEWASAPTRFLAEPFYVGGRNSQIVGLVETPFAWRRRLMFTGATSIKPPEKRKMDFIEMTLGNVNTSYRTTMTEADLEKFMLSGKTQPGFEGQVLHLIDETPTSLVVDTVKQIAAKNDIETELIWKNLAKVAADIKSPNKFWSELQEDDEARPRP